MYNNYAIKPYQAIIINAIKQDIHQNIQHRAPHARICGYSRSHGKALELIEQNVKPLSKQRQWGPDGKADQNPFLTNL